MSRVRIASFVLLGSSLWVGGGAAQQIKSPVVGTVKSGQVSFVNTSSTLLSAAEAPSTAQGTGKVLLLTQVYYTASNDVDLKIGERVLIHLTNTSGDGALVNFNPGIVVPEGSDLRAQSGGAVNITAMGVVTSKSSQ